jgi:hypothetical protein
MDPLSPAPADVPKSKFLIDGSIENVQSSTFGYLKRHLLWVVAVLAITIALLALLISMHVLFGAFYVMVLFIPIGGYSWVKSRVQHEFMEQFAAANGYAYAPTGPLDDLDGSLFRIGHNRSVADFIVGTYATRPISLFTYTYVTGSGKSQQTHHHTVFELQFDVVMPDILLESGGHFFGESLFQNLGGKETVKLEGDFNKYFSLYIPKGYETEALEIFTPDVMQELMDKAKGLSLEIVNGHCFIYANGILGTKQGLYTMYGLAEYFDGKLGPLLAQMKSSVEAMEEIKK